MFKSALSSVKVIAPSLDCPLVGLLRESFACKKDSYSMVMKKRTLCKYLHCELGHLHKSQKAKKLYS